MVCRLKQANHLPSNNQSDSQKTVQERMTHDYLRLELPSKRSIIVKVSTHKPPTDFKSSYINQNKSNKKN